MARNILLDDAEEALLRKWLDVNLRTLKANETFHGRATPQSEQMKRTLSSLARKVGMQPGEVVDAEFDTPPRTEDAIDTSVMPDDPFAPTDEERAESMAKMQKLMRQFRFTREERLGADMFVRELTHSQAPPLPDISAAKSEEFARASLRHARAFTATCDAFSKESQVT